MLRVLAKDETPSGGAVSPTDNSSGASTSVLLKFRLWWGDGIVKIDFLAVDDSLIAGWKPWTNEKRKNVLYSGAGAVFAYYKDDDTLHIVMPDKVTSDSYSSGRDRGQASLVSRGLRLLASLGTPDYDIADNTDPDKVFTVYAREEK